LIAITAHHLFRLVRKIKRMPEAILNIPLLNGIFQMSQLLTHESILYFCNYSRVVIRSKYNANAALHGYDQSEFHVCYNASSSRVRRTSMS
jgi:hypothetical protein